MQSFSTWPASSNQNVDDLIKGGFFYTGGVFYKTKTYLLQNLIFLEEATSIKLLSLQE